MVASVTIWVGVCTDAKTESAVRLSSILNDNQWDELIGFGEIKAEGLTFQSFHRFDDGVGFGVKLFSRTYHDGTKEIDLESLRADGQKLLAQVAQVFRSWGSGITPKIFIDMDYR